MPRLRFYCALLALLATGCAMDLPDARVIISNRALAIQTAVTASPFPDQAPDLDRPKAQALPFETVTITPFIVNELGAVDPDSLDVIWLACELTPGLGLFSCISAAMPLTLDQIPECTPPSFDALMGETLPELVSPCLIGREGTPEYVAPLSANVFVGGSIELTMIAGVPGGTSTNTCAAELLRGEYDLPNDCLYAVQRLNIGPVELLLSIAAQFGLEIPGFEIPDPADLPEPDHNPRISEVRVGVINDQGEQVGDAQIVPFGGLFTAPRELTLQVEIDSPAEDLQTFLVPVNNGESYEERSEAYQGDWYRTWGQLLSGTSDDPMSYNQWVLSQGDQDETESPVDGRARMYYVVRDSRQGVNWFWFEVEVTDPEPLP
jgi:hypothetical protein